MSEIGPLEPRVLPAGVRARFVEDVNGLRMHILEAGFGTPGRPGVLLLHGFPELAYSWRKVLPLLAEAGFHAVAPDQRGFGRTTGWDAAYDVDLRPFGPLNAVRDQLALVSALGWRSVAGLAGQDYGSSVAAWCALIRPDVFRTLTLMTAPFAGPPETPFATDGKPAPKPPAGPTVHEALAALPRPRKHYHWYYATRPANDDLMNCPQGVHAFLRAYFHHKSADWKANKPHPLAGWTADELAKMPTYYIMDRDKTMPECVAAEMPTPAEIAACAWLTEDELRVYSGEYERTGFQGGLNLYRTRTEGVNDELDLFSGRTIEAPTIFVSGKSDWGVFQTPGAFEAMQTRACTDFRGATLLDGAGHWVQQERPEEVARLLIELFGGRV